MPPIRRFALVLLAVLAAVHPSAAFATDTLTLVPVKAVTNGKMSAVFDASRRRFVLVGGVHPAPAGQVQVLDLSAAFPAWSNVPTLGTPPPMPTQFAPAIYDRLRDRMIVLEYGTMWSLALGTMTWTSTTPSGTAPELEGAEVVYDSARDRLVGFGTDGATSRTWTLSLGGSPAWSTLGFVGPVPPPRTEGVGVYDAASDRMVVALGIVNGAVGNDAWQLTLAGTPAWSSLTTTGTPPSARKDVAFAFDPATRVLRTFGGISSSAPLDQTHRLDLATGTWSAGSTGAEPPARYGAAAAWDSVGARMVLAAGVTPVGLGDGWQLSGTTWSRLPVSGGTVAQADWAHYDPAGHRWPARADGCPAFLSMIDSTWSLAGPPNTPLGQVYFTFYDPQLNLLGTADIYGYLYTIHPYVDAAWTTVATTGNVPSFTSPGTVYEDRVNHRVILFGGYTIQLGPDVFEPVVRALDYQTGFWSTLAGSTPLSWRETASMEDTRRHRALFFGGMFPSGTLGGTSGSNDTQAMNLTTLAFTTLAPSGTLPSPRYLFPAAYDSLRDRCVIFGGIQFGIWLHGVYYLTFGPGDANGAWSRNDPIGDAVPDVPGLDGGIDPALDRFFVPGVSSYYALAWDPVGAPALVAACPPKTAWTTGANLPLTFRLAQSSATPVSYGWTLTSQRSWPNFPLTGFQQLNDANPFDLLIQVPVPDTAAAGIDTLTFSISDGTHTDSCRVAIGDQASPSPWALIQAFAERNRVRLEWWTSERAGVADVERRGENGAWEALGVASVGSDGTVGFEDDAVEPGARYGYRAGVGGVWSDEARVDVPAAALAFARSSLVAHGALEVAFTLPDAGPARLEAFDLAGRRVASREVTGEGAHAVDLGGLRSGVYFLRLVQNGAKVTARAVVVGAGN